MINTWSLFIAHGRAVNIFQSSYYFVGILVEPPKRFYFFQRFHYRLFTFHSHGRIRNH